MKLDAHTAGRLRCLPDGDKTFDSEFNQPETSNSPPMVMPIVTDAVSLSQPLATVVSRSIQSIGESLFS